MGLPSTPAGNLFAVSNNSGHRRAHHPGRGHVDLRGATGLNRPSGIAIDSAGNLYVSNLGDDTIERFTPGGAGSVFATAANGLSSPTFLAFTTDAGVPLGLPPIPEPSAVLTLAFGAAALFTVRRFTGQSPRRS